MKIGLFRINLFSFASLINLFGFHHLRCFLWQRDADLLFLNSNFCFFNSTHCSSFKFLFDNSLRSQFATLEKHYVKRSHISSLRKFDKQKLFFINSCSPTAAGRKMNIQFSFFGYFNRDLFEVISISIGINSILPNISGVSSII